MTVFLTLTEFLEVPRTCHKETPENCTYADEMQSPGCEAAGKLPQLGILLVFLEFKRIASRPTAVHLSSIKVQ